MEELTSTALLLRRVEYGDADLILTLLTPEAGKLSAMAKSARKSVKRFGGILEPFTLMGIVCARGRANLPLLREASLENAFYNIRSDIRKTAYASYWTELVDGWLEERKPAAAVFHLLSHMLGRLDGGAAPEGLSILFQIRFMALCGLAPQLARCNRCGAEIGAVAAPRMVFDIAAGGVMCDRCGCQGGRRAVLSKGTVKQLLWAGAGDLRRAGRLRFSPRSIAEGLDFLETFVPYHLGRNPRSLAFLRRLRREASP